VTLGLATVPVLSASAAPTPIPTPDGIAARYPGDKNIASDPDVLLADDFESYASASQATTRWTSADHVANMRIATEPGNYFAGNKALEMTLPISTTEMVDALHKHLNPEQDTVFIRTYCKFDPNYSSSSSNHNGIRLSARYPGPGSKPPADGTGFFLFLLQNDFLGLSGETDPGYCHIYAYWPKQRDNFGDHWYPTGSVVPYSNTIGNQGEWLAFPGQYPDFQPYPNFVPLRDKWYCYELMVKSNTPGKNDGEVKYWVDGNLVSDFPDLVMRSISTLKIDEAVVVLHAGKNEQVNRKWYDNVVIATKYIGPMVSPSPTATPNPSATPAPNQVVFGNLSTRGRIGLNDEAMITGFIVSGTEQKTIIARALGPSLARAGVQGVMTNPTLELRDSAGNLMTTNDNWRDSQAMLFVDGGPYAAFRPPNELESAISLNLNPGAYTAIIRGKNNTTGVALAELYDYSGGANVKFTNVSTRGFVGTGDNVLIGGLIVNGTGSSDVIVRAMGPSLAQYGISNALADPTMEFYDGNGALIAFNDNWGDDALQAEQIQQNGFAPPSHYESAMALTLSPGNYTGIVRGKNSSVGVGLFEVYNLR
jgi:hypothetical protein